tara:strand:+ start:1663 stop:1764 length:102 start_codon:yes stop_codon:yes gene_type:complete
MESTSSMDPGIFLYFGVASNITNYDNCREIKDA